MTSSLRVERVAEHFVVVQLITMVDTSCCRSLNIPQRLASSPQTPSPKSISSSVKLSRNIFIYQIPLHQRMRSHPLVHLPLPLFTHPAIVSALKNENSVDSALFEVALYSAAGDPDSSVVSGTQQSHLCGYGP